MQMGTGLDTGDMISQTAVTLDEKETGGSLFDKLADLGADLLVKTLPSCFDKNSSDGKTAGGKSYAICFYDHQADGTYGLS